MTAIYVALVIYMVVLFGVGLFYSKKNATINDFLLAGRDLGVVAATLTVTASLFGGGLPAFLVKNPGLNNGFMIPQYVTAGLLGDIALLCAPAAAFNAAVSAGQESPVYRDDTAARQLYQAVQKLRSNEAILKKPSIAETLDWAAALDALGLRELTPDAMAQTAGFVLKNNEDMLLLSQQEQPGEHCGHCQGHSHG